MCVCVCVCVLLMCAFICVDVLVRALVSGVCVWGGGGVCLYFYNT